MAPALTPDEQTRRVGKTQVFFGLRQIADLLFERTQPIGGERDRVVVGLRLGADEVHRSGEQVAGSVPISQSHVDFAEGAEEL